MVNKRDSDSTVIKLNGGDQESLDVAMESRGRAGGPIRDQDGAGDGTVLLAGFLLAGTVSAVALTLAGRFLISMILPVDSRTMDTVSVVLIAIGFGMALLVPRKRAWGYVAYALIGVGAVLWLAGTALLATAWVLYLLNVPVLELHHFEQDIVAPIWAMIYSVCVTVLCFRSRAKLSESTSHPKWAKAVGHLVKAETASFIWSMLILAGLGVIVFVSTQAYDLIQG